MILLFYKNCYKLSSIERKRNILVKRIHIVQQLTAARLQQVLIYVHQAVQDFSVLLKPALPVTAQRHVKK